MMKKLVALILAVVMVMAMGSVAFAADDTYSGSKNTNATSVAGNTTIPLTKGIVFFNANGSAVYEPNVTFSYAVEPASIAASGGDATVTDDAALHAPDPAVTSNVYPGPADGVTGTTIAFAANTTNGTHTAAAAGTEVERTGNLTLDINKFSRPGIYRYIITESVTAPATGSTDSEKLQAAGLAARDSAYDNTRYLDVYIHYNASGDLEMYGAVLFKTTESSGDEGEDDITTTTKKTTGFEPNPTADGSITYSNDPNVDKYYTYDFTVKKTVSGSMADKNHEFPFYVSVSNSINGAMFTYTADGSETFNGMSVSSGSDVATLNAASFSIGSDSKDSTLALKSNDYIKLVGVPSNQTTDLTVDVKEFNNTYDQYTATAKAKVNGTETAQPTTPAGGVMAAMTSTTTSTAALASAFNLKTNDANQEIVFDNNLTEISVTGVVMRVAPYVLILAAGMTLLLISRRRKAEEE